MNEETRNRLIGEDQAEKWEQGYEAGFKAAVEWVDCQDRQPAEMEMHSVTHLDGDTLKVTTLFWNPYYSAWMYQGKPTTMKVIAWLPKPQPYQPKEEQDA